jgi:hypothetical protein
MPASANPYAPPKAHVDDVRQANSEAEEIRQEHIKHEASIRAVGMLYYLGGALLFLVMLALTGSSTVFGPGEQASSLTWILILAYALLGGGTIVVGRGLRQFRPWARVTGIVLAAIGLLGFPLGTILNGYILYLLLSKKGQRIFASDYPDIVEATPHIKYRTALLVKILLVILIVLVVAGALTVIFRGT